MRATSGIIDGFLHSTMYHALSELEQNLREHGYQQPMLVNHNSGGMAQLNSTDALQTIHSGPVSGVSASEHLAKQAGLGNVVATDMGGTSFDIGLVPGDGVKHYDFMPVIDRWLVSVPMIHLVTLGAGGGSIASFNRLYQSISVGPQSAGSDPGPACYDRGGMRPTVTDADVLLGYLDPGAVRRRADSAQCEAGGVRNRRGVRRPPRPGTGRRREADQSRGRRADGQRHGEGTARAGLSAGGVHHARVRRQRAAALLRHRQPSGYRPGARTTIQLGVLRSRRRQHAAVAHPRADHAGPVVRRDQPPAVRGLRHVQRDRRRAGGKGSS